MSSKLTLKSYGYLFQNRMHIVHATSGNKARLAAARAVFDKTGDHATAREASRTVRQILVG